jgi:pyrroline-5-carboxylate reductase
VAKIGILGYGNMGSSLALGLREAGGHRIVVAEISEARARLAEGEGFRPVEAAAHLFRETDLVVLAVKPQDWQNIARSVGPAGKDSSVGSVMAGVTIETIQRDIGARQVARMMPNLAASQRQALVGISVSEGADEAFRTLARAVAQAIGEPMEVPEKLMAAITGISGSGIAFVFAFLHAMALGGVRSGLPYPQALQAALKATEGAVAVIRAGGEHPIEWLSRVVSPAGTTIAGVAALEAGGLAHTVMEAVTAASQRAADLEG